MYIFETKKNLFLQQVFLPSEAARPEERLLVRRGRSLTRGDGHIFRHKSGKKE
jgi:hypothetical protein